MSALIIFRLVGPCYWEVSMCSSLGTLLGVILVVELHNPIPKVHVGVHMGLLLGSHWDCHTCGTQVATNGKSPHFRI